jgi:BirA family transcriptional regulator, biotin operon repressor / biotin---[acetyl-CoA-carboxylase] ligase
MSERTVLSTYDDTPCADLRSRSGAAQVFVFDRCSSTMDLAHQFAMDGASHGTVVVAEEQVAGRGRTGKSWMSERGAGVWASVLVRQATHAPAGVLSLRVGLTLAERLNRYVPAPIQLKWPNDLFLDARKLAGVLAEARWRGDLLEWIVVGVGVNVRDSGANASSERQHNELLSSGQPSIATVGSQVRRSDILVDVISAILDAADIADELSPHELALYASRDLARGREVIAPLSGVVLGITARGGVQIRTSAGDQVAVAGSLVFRSPHPE